MPINTVGNQLYSYPTANMMTNQSYMGGNSNYMNNMCMPFPGSYPGSEQAQNGMLNGLINLVGQLVNAISQMVTQLVSLVTGGAAGGDVQPYGNDATFSGLFGSQSMENQGGSTKSVGNSWLSSLFDVGTSFFKDAFKSAGSGGGFWSGILNKGADFIGGLFS